MVDSDTTAERKRQHRLGAHYEAQQIRPYLDMLERRVRDPYPLSGSVRTSFEKHSFEQYVDMRNLLSECKALIVIIENRLASAREAGEETARLEDNLALLTTQLWETLLATALEFFRSVASSTRLPLGSRDVFVRELKTLHDARSLLQRPPYSARVEQVTMDNLDKAEKILREIIARAPGLLDLG